MSKFQCRCDDWHGVDEWIEIVAFDSAHAARRAAKVMDDDGGEGAHERVIQVRAIGCAVEHFSISFDYEPIYYARPVTPAIAQAAISAEGRDAT